MKGKNPYSGEKDEVRAEMLFIIHTIRNDVVGNCISNSEGKGTWSETVFQVSSSGNSARFSWCETKDRAS